MDLQIVRDHLLYCNQRKYIIQNTGPARWPAWLAGGKWPSRASFVGDGSFRGCPVRACAFSRMKPWTAWVRFHLNYSTYHSPEPGPRGDGGSRQRGAWSHPNWERDGVGTPRRVWAADDIVSAFLRSRNSFSTIWCFFGTSHQGRGKLGVALPVPMWFTMLFRCLGMAAPGLRSVGNSLSKFCTWGGSAARALSVSVQHTVIQFRLNQCLIWHLHCRGSKWDPCWNCAIKDTSECYNWQYMSCLSGADIQIKLSRLEPTIFSIPIFIRQKQNYRNVTSK
jgi:hypothetical protein